MCGCNGGAVVAVGRGCVAAVVVRWLQWGGDVWLRWWCGGCSGEGMCGYEGGVVVAVEGVCSDSMVASG